MACIFYNMPYVFQDVVKKKITTEKLLKNLFRMDGFLRFSPFRGRAAFFCFENAVKM